MLERSLLLCWFWRRTGRSLARLERTLSLVGRRKRLSRRGCRRGFDCADAVDTLGCDLARRGFWRRDGRVRVENRRLALRRATRDRAHTDAVFSRAVLHANRIRVPGIGESAAVVRAQSEVVHAHCHARLSYRVGELLVAEDHRHRNYGEAGNNQADGQTDAELVHKCAPRLGLCALRRKPITALDQADARVSADKVRTKN